MTYKQNIRHQCRVYIEAMLDGIGSDLLRSLTHMEFIRRLPEDVDPGFLLPILHNLDRVIGFDVRGVGTDVPEKQVAIWANHLFLRLWDIYKDEEVKDDDGGLNA